MFAASTVTRAITGEGAVVGTPHYMSPSKSRRRTSMHGPISFSFGVVLYEMVTGQRPFVGDTSASLLASILEISRRRSHSATRPCRARSNVSPQMPRKAVRRPVAQSARDLEADVELIDLDAPPASSSRSSAQVATPVRARPAWLWPAVAAIFVALAAAAAWIAWPATQPPARVTRFEVALPPGVQILPVNFYVRVSPDGSKLAFTRGRWHLDSRPGVDRSAAPARNRERHRAVLVAR